MSVEVEAKLVILVYALLGTLVGSWALIYYLFKYIRGMIQGNIESLEYAKLMKYLYEKEKEKNETGGPDSGEVQLPRRE